MASLLYEYQRVVDEIQFAIDSPDTADPDLFRDAVAMYGEACHETNDRLRQCHQLLRQGLRSEAIQMAEREPNLLDVVALLDFPELPQWHQQLHQWGMAQPPRLLVDLAGDLNEAYAEQGPLEKMLKDHRLLALARAPLASRIVVLRKIRGVDPHNPAWEEDLRALEKARIKQIEEQSEAAFKERNAAALAALDGELRSDGWLINHPTELVRRVSKRHRKLAAEKAGAEMVKIEEELGIAYAAFDVEAGQRARDRWEACAEVAGLPSDDPLLERAAPALEWLAEQDEQLEMQQRHKAAVDTLERALDEEQPTETLEKHHHDLVRLELGVPPLVERRYGERIAALELTRRRRHGLKLAGVIGAVLVVGGSTITITLYMKYRHDVTVAVQSLRGLRDDRKPEQAEQFYQGLLREKPGVAESGMVAAEKARLDDAIRYAQTKETEFDRLAVEAGRLMEQGKQELDENQPFETFKHVRRAEEVLDQATNVVSESEKVTYPNRQKALLADLRRETSKIRRKAQESIDGEFRAQLTKIQEDVNEVQHRLDSDIDTEGIEPLLSRLKLLASELEALIKRSGWVLPLLLEQAKPLQIRIVALQQDLVGLREQQRALQRIAEAVGNAERYRSALERYQQDFPDTPRARTFGRTIQEAPWWEGMSQWTTFLTQSLFTDLRAVTRVQAKQLVSDGRKLLELHSGIPLAQSFREREPVLEAIARRQNDDGRAIYESLRAVFGHPAVSKLMMIRLNNGTRYYLTGLPPQAILQGQKRFRIEYVVDLELTKKAAGVNPFDIDQTGPAPQNKVAASVVQKLNELTDADWDKSFYGMFQDVATDKDIDPILACILLHNLLEVGAQGSHFLQEGFEPHYRLLRESQNDLSGHYWLLPSDEEVDAARIKAKSVLDRMPPWVVAAQLRTRLQEMARPIALPRWIGWLGQDGRGGWKCCWALSGSGRPESGEFLVVRSMPGQESPRLERIGQLSHGQIVLKESQPGGLLEGRPIYLAPDGWR